MNGASRKWSWTKPALWGVVLLGGWALMCMDYTGENPFDPNVNEDQDPFAIRAVADSGAVRLSWNELKMPGVTKYILYRSVDDSSAFRNYDELSVGEKTRYIDSAVADTCTYYYKMTMIAGGEESNSSAVVSVIPLEAPSPKLSVTVGKDTTDTLDFMSDLSEVQVTIENPGSRRLAVEELTATPERWIAFEEVSDSTLAAGKTRTLTIRIVRDSLEARDEPYYGTVTIVSDGGTWSATVRAVAPPARLSVVLADEPVDTLDYDVNLDELLLTLKNSGGSPLHLEKITASAEWIVPDAITDSVIAVDGARPLKVSIVRDSLEYRDARHYGSVTINSDGGDTTLVVSVLQIKDVPRLLASTDSLSLDSTETTAFFTVTNGGDAVMAYCSLTTEQSWISLDPTTITDLGVGAEKKVGVTVDRDMAGMAIGDNVGLVHLNSDGGPADVVVLAYKKKPIAPLLELAVDTLDFEDKYDVRTLVLRNSGTGSLEWSISGVSEKWFSLEGSTSGTLDEDSSVEVSVEAFRDSITEPGTYHATVNVLSARGGDRSFVVRIVKADTDPPVQSVLEIDSTTPSTAALSWSRNSDVDFVAYKVYRNDDSTVNNQDELLYETQDIDDTTFVDSGLTSLQSYYYRIYTYDADDKLSGSNFVKATTTPWRTLSGTVYDKRSGAPLAGVLVTMNGTSEQATTESNGTYEFLNPDTGVAHILFTVGNYLSSGKQTTIAKRGVTSLSDSLMVLPRVNSLFELNVAQDNVALSVSDLWILASWMSNGVGQLAALNSSTTTGGAVSSTWCVDDDNRTRILAEGRNAFIAIPFSHTILYAQDWNVAFSKRDTSVLVDSVPHTVPESTYYEYVYDDSCLQDNRVASIFDPSYMPNDLAIAGSDLYVAGKSTGSGIVVTVLNQTSLTETNRYEIPDFPTRSTGVVEVDLDGDILYLVSNALLEGRLLRLELSSGNMEQTVLPMTQIADVAVSGQHIYVCSQDNGADSVFIYNHSLEQTGSIPVPYAGYRFSVCTTGLYRGTIAMTSSEEANVVTFIDGEAGVTAGEIAFDYDVVDFEFLSDGSGAVAAVNGKVHILRP